MTDPTVPIVFRADKQAKEKLAKKLPKRGDQSRLLRRLLEMYLDGQVKVVVPARTF
jgi:hypothetical protein